MPLQRRCDDFCLVFGRWNVVPCVMCPDVVLVSEKSYDNCFQRLTQICITYREPKGGSSAPTSCTEDVDFLDSISASGMIRPLVTIGYVQDRIRATEQTCTKRYWIRFRQRCWALPFPRSSSSPFCKVPRIHRAPVYDFDYLDLTGP